MYQLSGRPQWKHNIPTLNLRHRIVQAICHLPGRVRSGLRGHVWQTMVLVDQPARPGPIQYPRKRIAGVAAWKADTHSMVGKPERLGRAAPPENPSGE